MAISLTFAIALLGLPPPPPPPDTPICAPAAGAEADAVAYLRGRYRVVGVRNEDPYTGTLLVDGTENSRAVTISGVVGGIPVQGSAKNVRCGADEVPRLEVSMQSGSSSHILYCVPHTDYDNFNRASCTASLSDPNGDIELWHEQYTP